MMDKSHKAGTFLIEAIMSQTFNPSSLLSQVLLSPRRFACRSTVYRNTRLQWRHSYRPIHLRPLRTLSLGYLPPWWVRWQFGKVTGRGSYGMRIVKNACITQMVFLHLRKVSPSLALSRWASCQIWNFQARHVDLPMMTRVGQKAS